MAKRKTDRDADLYLKIGAMMRLLHQINIDVSILASGVLKAKDIDQWTRAEQKIELIRSRAEDYMFEDHPELSNDYLNAFYGSLFEESDSEVDRKAAEIVESYLRDFLERLKNVPEGK